jgi:thiol:disulfide interchange protein DsbD
VCAAVAAHAAPPAVDAKWDVVKSAAPEAAPELVLAVTVERGWHLNANDPDRPYLIPTTLEIAPSADAVVASIQYPDAVVRGLAFAPGTPLRLYEGTFAIRVRLAGELPPHFDATLRYQACNDETCLPPRSVEVPFAARGAKP